MTVTQLTIVVLAVFMAAFIGISWWTSRQNSATAGSYVVGDRSLGTFPLLLSMSATYFSTWTLLGSFGSYYRDGLWFTAFGTWAVIQVSVYVWLFGGRIWLAGKRFGFITPGQMMEHYYRSPVLRLAYTLVGICALVPVMLIQLTGGATALESLTDGAIPYTVGVTIASVSVATVVLWAGFRGTVWMDAFMGVFFGAVMLFSLAFVAGRTGYLDMFRSAAEADPSRLVVSGRPFEMLELWLGLSIGAWVLPHMWQKFYSARDPKVLGKVAAISPFWTSWLMALVPMFIGIAAIVPGLVPGADENSDSILPLLFAEYLPIVGALVVAGILAAAMSTINSQLLSSASLVAEDVWRRFFDRELTGRRLRNVNRVVVAGLTLLVYLIALSPQGAGYLVPVSALGFGLGLQLVPTALGVLYLRGITPHGALAGLVAGVVALALVAITGLSPLGPGLSGLAVNIAVTAVVSRFTAPVDPEQVATYRHLFSRYYREEAPIVRASEQEGVR
ncbi:sodium:solute symporter [Ornithinimicrobium sp. LYQ92]|uniref:sodium:solute symporter family protein n=1 Tax=Serinicoccus sp. LYQ92 TaxID=3378798 RepID=UPI003852A718